VIRKCVLAALLLFAIEARATSVFVAPVPAVRGAVSETEAAAMTRAIESAVLARIVGVDVVTPSALDAKLEIDLVKACSTGDDTSCVVDFAQSMGVQYVMRSSLTRLDGTSLLTVSLYDGQRAALLGQAQRSARATSELLAQARPVVVEVAQSAGLSVVVERQKPSALVPALEIGGGALVVLGSAATHVVSLLVVEPTYADAEFTRDEARAWEFARPFAYGVPLLGYIAGATLVGIGVWTWPSEDET
jgi:hypothetical protein